MNLNYDYYKMKDEFDEAEATRLLATFRQLPSEKRAMVFAFMNGMEVQRTIDAASPSESAILP